ncbi:MAG TPA: DUF2911 domain-containing protein [Saprospiraceae bacterium]|nr:DUF2911 domain-containing protein [Saprospiraceae bacterium]
MKQLAIFTLICLVGNHFLSAQGAPVTLPTEGGNITCSIGQRIGVTNINVHWDAPGVKGREGKIWGTQIVHYGFQDPQFGTSKSSPWRAGANENTTISFSTDVSIEGKKLAVGKYGFFIAVYPDSCTLIFSKNSGAWGSYFYKTAEDALRVTVRQQKNLPASREWLAYLFSEPSPNSVVLALEWERWRIPFKVEVDVPRTVVETLRGELQDSRGFVYENWTAAAQFCLQNNYNLEEALTWADNAITQFYGVKNFATYSLKAQIEEKLGRKADADATMKKAMEKADVADLHQYGRQLIASKQAAKALEVFQLNHQKNGDVWPIHAGLMRGYSANGDLKKALEQAKIALTQAPDEQNKKTLEGYIKTLSEGKPIEQ